MFKLVTTQVISQKTEIFCDSFADRDKIENKLKRFKKYVQKDGLFGIGGDWLSGSKQIGHSMVPVIWVFCNDDNKNHDEIVAMITKFLIENGNTVSAETKIFYEGSNI